MTAVTLTRSWTRVADPGGPYMISRPGLRHIVLCDSAERPAEYVHGTRSMDSDLLPSAENSERSVSTPTFALWLRVADDYGACPIEVRALEEVAS